VQKVSAAHDVAEQACDAAERGVSDVTAGHDIQAPDAESAFALLKTAERAAGDDAAGARSAAQEAERRVSDRRTMEARIKDERDQISVLGALGNELRGDRFGEYIVLETLDLLAAHASAELLRISDGRYSLVPVEGDFQVVDHANADEQRSVKTLSGGETFLASLALALALSRHVGDLATEGLGAKLEAVFIDEGFGTLDPATLDEVIDALERLRADDLIVGVISHVPELAQRVRVGLEVQKQDGRSTIVASTGG
jgi:exonuclease SbcC